MQRTHDVPRLTRAGFLCGARSLALSAAALAAMPALARADDHAQERSIGDQVYADQRKQGTIIDESPYYGVLHRVGARISNAAAPHWYTMKWVIVKGKQANAFSVPGGWVYVNEALLKQAENEEELASVLGHETGHLVLGHVMNRLKQAQNLNMLFTIASLFVHTQGAANVFNLAEFGASYGFLNFSRQQEYQADHEGVILTNLAAYNPWGMVWFFKKLQKLYGDVGFEQFVQDHPSSKDRIARIEAYFRSDPTAYARWPSTMYNTAGLALGSSDVRLIVN
jgi:predicted Zn-dependent protease